MNRFSRRDKYAIYAGCGCLAVFVLLQFLVFPLVDKKKRLERVVEVKSAVSKEMLALAADYRIEKKVSESIKAQVAGRKEGFSLFPFLDNLAGKSGIKNRVEYMKPSFAGDRNSGYRIAKVEVKLNRIDLHQLTSFLYAVETSENWVVVDRISISASEKNDNGLDVLVLFETFIL